MDKRKVISILAIISAIVFLFLAYAAFFSPKESANDTVNSKQEQSGQEQPAEKQIPETISDEEPITDDLPESVTVSDSKIFFYEKEAGYIEDSIIHIRMEDGYVSFKGELGKITPYPFERKSGFFYDGLEVSDTVACRYAICEFYDTVSYACDGPIIKKESLITPQWAGCESNGKDYLAQYEFDAGNGNGFTTGGEVDYSWYRFYMRRFGDKDLFFFGNMGESWWEGNPDPNAEHIKTKAYLDELLTDETNKQTIARWDEFVNSLDFTPIESEKVQSDPEPPSGGWDITTDYKPVIYLYPEKIQPTKVSLDYDGRLTATYPPYDNGWQVTAYPDGRLINSTDQKEYSYLFWEGVPEGWADYDWNKGFVVKGEDTAEFLQEKLSEIGLTPKEYNEFIVYWMPRMQNNGYNLIHFASKEEYADHARLSIEPQPDSVLRVFMAYKPLDRWQKVQSQEIKSFERRGFTVVEWGGTEIR
jgi:hypothetical protein